MSEPWPVHTVVFDLDDTLYPELDFVLSGFAAVDACLREGRGVEGFAEKARELFAAGRRGKIMDEVLPLLGLARDQGLVAELVETYRNHSPNLQLFPDATEILDWLTPRFRLGLITDGCARAQMGKIRALRLDGCIPYRIITDELGRAFGKPSTEPYRRLAALCPGGAEGFVYVADNPHKDFLGAKQSGWRTIRIRRQGGEHAEYVATAAESAEVEVSLLSELRLRLVPDAGSAAHGFTAKAVDTPTVKLATMDRFRPCALGAEEP